MISLSLGGRMPRVVMLVGPCGAGKSSALQRMRPVLGSRVGEVAVLETDTTYMMIDPTWSVYNSHYDSIAKRTAARIAADFVREGFDWVAVGSNGLQDRAGVEDFVAHLPDGVEVYHVFLDPSVAAVQDRIAARAHPLDAQKTPEWLEGNVSWMRTFHDSWSALIDNSDLGVDETVNAIYETVESGRGKIRRSTPAQQDLAAVDIAYRVDKAVDVAAWLRLFHACGWNSDWTAHNAKVMVEHAYLVVTAHLGGEIVGTLTVLSDGLN